MDITQFKNQLESEIEAIEGMIEKDEKESIHRLNDLSYTSHYRTYQKHITGLTTIYHHLSPQKYAQLNPDQKYEVGQGFLGILKAIKTTINNAFGDWNMQKINIDGYRELIYDTIKLR